MRGQGWRRWPRRSRRDDVRVPDRRIDRETARLRAEIIAAFPVVLRPNGPGTKTAAAIRACTGQDVFDTGTAEGACKRTNHRIRGIRWKRRVAVRAGGSQFEHDSVGPECP
jgi:hypothetical protein